MLSLGAVKLLGPLGVKLLGPLKGSLDLVFYFSWKRLLYYRIEKGTLVTSHAPLLESHDRLREVTLPHSPHPSGEETLGAARRPGRRGNYCLCTTGCTRWDEDGKLEGQKKGSAYK